MPPEEAAAVIQAPWGSILAVGAIVLLLLLSAFFSGSETAMTAASRAKMHRLAQEGSRPASLVNRLRDRPEKMIGAILLGNNLVNILASALATSLLIGLVGEAAVPLATLVMTLLVLVFAEVLPKTYALHRPERVALAIAPLMRLVVDVLSPITEAVDWIVQRVIRILARDPEADAAQDSVNELRGAIDLHSSDTDDVESQEKRAMLRSILDLADVDVSEIMTHRKNVYAIDIDLPKEEIAAAVLESTFTRIPVWRGDPENIVGVLNVKDFLRALNGATGDAEAVDMEAIKQDPWFIPDTTILIDQLQAFRTRREHFAIVIDEYGALQGVVSLEDILEEIVGEIDDEHDEPVAGVRRAPGGSYIADGTVTIRDLNRQFEWRLPDENASTIAGLVLHEARRIPDVGQSFTFYGFRFEILKRQRHQVTSLRISPPPPEILERNTPHAAS